MAKNELERIYIRRYPGTRRTMQGRWIDFKNSYRAYRTFRGVFVSAVASAYQTMRGVSLFVRASRFPLRLDGLGLSVKFGNEDTD